MRNNRSTVNLVLAIVFAAALSACDAQPYVLNVSEFDRSAENFGKDPTDISDVTVCYNKSSTTPEVVRGMAVQACAAFGKYAKFVDQDHLKCPLTTPVAANYTCESRHSLTSPWFSPYTPTP